MRRTLLIVLSALVAVLALGRAVVATGGDGSSITRPRLERSLPATFSHLYVQQARSSAARASPRRRCTPRRCATRRGAKRPDAGPGRTGSA